MIQDNLRARMAEYLNESKHVAASMFSVWTCEFCPFNAPTFEPYDDIWPDVSEAHYKCPVSTKTVWGENPDCAKALVKIALGIADPPPIFEGDRYAGISETSEEREG